MHSISYKVRNWRTSGPNRFPPISWPWYRASPSPIMSGFHRAFATGVACQQGTLTLPDTWFRPPFWDLLMLQLLRPNSSNLPCLYSTFHLEYPLVLSRFCFVKFYKPTLGPKYVSSIHYNEFITPTTFLCRLRSIAAHRDHFVRRLSVCASVCPIVTLPLT